MSARARIFLGVLGLWLAQGLFPGAAEALQVTLLGALLPERELAALRSVSIASEPVSADVPSLEADATRHQLIVAAGFREGVRCGAEVSSGGQFIGLVDAVGAHMSRVRMLGGRALRLPVTACGEGAEPQTACTGTLITEAGLLVFTDAARAELLPVGALVHLVRETGERGALLGRITTPGPRPAVTARAPDLGGPVRIAGVAAASDLAAQYLPVAVESWCAPLGPDARWLLRCRESGFRVGSAVLNEGGACVALVDVVAGEIALASPPAGFERGLPVALRGPGYDGFALLRGAADGPELLLTTKAPVKALDVELFTTAGTGLVPRGLLLGQALVDEHGVARLRLASAAGPLVVLRFGDEDTLERLRTQP